MKIEFLKKFEDLMVAATFAEKGEHDYAIWLVNSATGRKKQHNIKKRLNRQLANRPQIRL